MMNSDQRPEGEGHPDPAPASSVVPTPLHHHVRIPPERLLAAGVTDVGLVRDNNEDAFLVQDLRENGRSNAPAVSLEVRENLEDACLLLAVSDGMGGQLAGEVASATTLGTLDEKMVQAASAGGLLSIEDAKRRLEQAVHEANVRVQGESKRDASMQGMGATLSALLVLGDLAIVAHVGDSRAYLLRGGRLRQLTMDHTHVQDLVARGHLSVEQARQHHDRNLLVQAIGVFDHVGVDLTELAASSGDTIMLCSDGLHDFVSDRDLSDVLGSSMTPAEQCADLVERAKQGGGSDNITVVVAHFE